MATDRQEIKAIQSFQRNPLAWVKDIFPDVILTSQQEQGFIELGNLISAKLKAFKGETLTEEEKRYARKIGISIMSGQGTGKDAFAALVCWFFLYCFSNCKIPCTAPTSHQLQNVLWAEMSKWKRYCRKLNPADDDSPKILDYLFEMQTERVFLREKKGKEWFAVARTVNAKASPDEQAETLAGFHEEHMLFVVDEASGVPDPVFKPIEGTLTGKLNIVLMIFNPTRSKGFAVDSQFGDRERWVTLRWNSEESSIVTREHIENMAKKYGRDSNTYRIRVLGLPPLADADTLIPWDWVLDAVDKPLEIAEDDPLVFGIDVGAGGDSSIILHRHGAKVEKITPNNSKNTMELTGWAAMQIEDYNPQAVYIDVIGLGNGVYNRLLELGHRVYAVDVRGKARRDEKFKKLRDELWWTLREQFEKGLISIPNDDELIGELSTIKYKVESDGRIKVEGKEELKRRGVESPDKADALMMTYYMDDRVFRKSTRETDKYRKKKNEHDNNSWMAA